MATIAAAVNSSVTDWTVSADIGDDIVYLLAEDELVRVAATFPSSIYAPTGETTPPRVRVERAVGGTTAASHAQGTSLTEYRDEEAFGFGGGGGDPGDQTVYVQPTDPGVVGAGKLWVDTTDPPLFAVRRRTPDDDGWWELLDSYVAVGPVDVNARDVLIWFRRWNADGSILRNELKMEPGDTRMRSLDEAGTIISEWEVSTDGMGALVNDELGTSRVGLESGAGDSGDTDARYELTIFDAASAMKAQFRLDETGVHFGGVVPEVPASPTEQDIVVALLALGLVTQAP